MSQTSLLPNQAMALSQLYTNAIVDEALLEVLASTPREMFVPAHLSDCAYIDEDLLIGEGRYMLAPLDQARLIQAADIKSTDRVLVIAAGAGHSTAIIARLAHEVIGIDRSAMFKQNAEEQFAALNLNNVSMEVVEDISQGLPTSAPYDVIIINGSTRYVPDTLASQLTESGRLVFVQAINESKPGVQGLGKLTIATRRNMRLEIRQTLECFVPGLKEFEATQGFNFS